MISADETTRVLDVVSKLSRDDPALHLPETAKSDFLAKGLTPRSFDHDVLFANMATQTPVLFSDFPAPLSTAISKDREAHDQRKILVELLKDCAGSERYKVRFGNSDNVQYLTIAEIMLRWRASGTVLGISDLPIRGRVLASVFDEGFLDFCNLMPLGSDVIRQLEMLTAVISKAGKLTDSHSDDLAVCNHCFLGEKLWFAWDTNEGLDAGLEDVERVKVRGRAQFSIETFASLKSSIWFFVLPGETIFLPGMYTHRVYTLEDYIGVGSFYIALPNIIHTASRWLRDGSVWDPSPESNEPRPLDAILPIAQQKLSALKQGSALDRKNCGYEELPLALRHWKEKLGHKTGKLQHQALNEFIDSATYASHPSGRVGA